MGLVLVFRHKPICIAVSLWKHACKEVCDGKPGLDPCPLLAWSWNRWWLDFVSFIAYKKFKIKLKKAKCVSNRCNDLFKWKKYFGFRRTLITKYLIPILNFNPDTYVSLRANPYMVRVVIRLIMFVGQVRVRQHVGYFGVQHSAFCITCYKGCSQCLRFVFSKKIAALFSK